MCFAQLERRVSGQNDCECHIIEPTQYAVVKFDEKSSQLYLEVRALLQIWLNGEEQWGN